MDQEMKAISEELNRLLCGSGKTISSAESCTGGNIAAAITAIPGSSEYFKGSIVVYSDEMKVKYLRGNNPRLHTDEVLVALAMVSITDPNAKKAIEQLPKLAGSQVHTTVMLSEVDINVFKKLGVNLTQDPVYQTKKLYHSK